MKAMPTIIKLPEERTTAATDLVIAALALSYSGRMLPRSSQRARLWGGAFTSMGTAAVCGAAAHGLVVDERTNAALWRVINLSLGLTVAFFAAAATNDGFGERPGQRTLPLALLSALGFYAASQRLKYGYIVFIIYESLALLYALIIYLRLARSARFPGAWRIVAGILLSLIAAAIQATPLRIRLVGLPFDHNGLYHLVQTAALPLLAGGVAAGLPASDQ